MLLRNIVSFSVFFVFFFFLGGGQIFCFFEGGEVVFAATFDVAPAPWCQEVLA